MDDIICIFRKFASPPSILLVNSIGWKFFPQKGEPDDMSRVESPFAAPAERDQTVLSESVVNSCVESEYNQTPDLQEANPPPPPPSAEYNFFQYIANFKFWWCLNAFFV